MANGEGTSTDPRLRDPLSDVTRKERAYLLGLSAAGIVIVFTGLVPERITALGIQFAETDQRTLLRLLAIVIAYFLVAFLIYAATDVLASRRLFHEEIRQEMRTAMKLSEMGEDFEDAIEREIRQKYQMTYKLSRWTFVLRFIFEFVLPFLIAIYSIYLLAF